MLNRSNPPSLRWQHDLEFQPSPRSEEAAGGVGRKSIGLLCSQLWGIFEKPFCLSRRVESSVEMFEKNSWIQWKVSLREIFQIESQSIRSDKISKVFSHWIWIYTDIKRIYKFDILSRIIVQEDGIDENRNRGRGKRDKFGRRLEGFYWIKKTRRGF